MKPRLLFACFFSLCLLSSAFSQGPLAPPGAPAPTMKSLDQIEARSPIPSAPFTINAPGSYYLTRNLAVAGGDAITITATGVSLDLNGFTISSSANPAVGTGVLLSGGVPVVTISNGHIRGGVTFAGGGGDQYVGPGFANGISWTNFVPINVKVSNVSVDGCDIHGIELGVDNSNSIDHCNVRVVGGNGLHAGRVTDSIAYTCGGPAISGNTVQNSYAVSTAAFDGIDAVTISNCVGSSDSGAGFSATSACNSYGISNSGVGFSASNAIDCYGSSNSGDGISADEVTNCRGISGGGTKDGISAFVANNCRGTSVGGNGIVCNVAQNCYGFSSTFIGLQATNTVQNCFGRSNNNTGLETGMAENCFGDSASGAGLLAFRGAIGSFGGSNSGNAGLHVLGVASYCSGVHSGGGTAINCAIALGCATFGGGITAPQGKFLGTP